MSQAQKIQLDPQKCVTAVTPILKKLGRLETMLIQIRSLDGL